MDGVVRQPPGKTPMRPRQPACAAAPRLVAVQHRGARERRLDRFLDRDEGRRPVLHQAQ